MPGTTGTGRGTFRPVDNDDYHLKGKPKGIVGIVTYLQKWYNIEKLLIKYRDLPDQLFPFQENIWLINASFKLALGIEFFFFVVLLYPMHVLIKSGVWSPFHNFSSNSLSYLVSYLGLAFITLAYMWIIAKFYLEKSVVLKQAVYALVGGRVMALFFKAILFFLLLSVIGTYLYTEKVWTFANTVKDILNILPGRDFTTEEIATYIWQTKPVVYSEMIQVPLIFISAGFILLGYLFYRKTKLKSDKVLSAEKYIEKDKIHIGSGFSLDPDADLKSKPLHFDYKEANVHTGIVGTTGSGKTRLLSYIVEQNIRNGDNVVVIDPKGDWDLFSHIYQVALEEERDDEIIYISPVHWQYSAELNPLSHYFLPDEIVSHVVAGVKTREEYFLNIARGITYSVVEGLHILNHDNPDFKFSFEEIMKYTSKDGLEKLRTLLSNYTPKDAQEKARIASVIRRIDQIHSYPIDFFSKVASGLNIVLAILTSGTLGRIIGMASDNLFLKRMEEIVGYVEKDYVLKGINRKTGKKEEVKIKAGKEFDILKKGDKKYKIKVGDVEGEIPKRLVKHKGVIMVVQTGSMMINEVSGIVGKILLSMIQSIAGRYDQSGKKFPRPLQIHIDEAYTMFYSGIENLYDKGRGVGVYVWTYFQSVAQVYARLNKDLGDAILDNINNWVVLRTKKYSAEYFSSAIGETDIPKPIISNSFNVSVVYERQPLVPPERILNLPDRQFVMQTKARAIDNIMSISYNTYIGQIPYIEDPIIRIVPEKITAA